MLVLTRSAGHGIRSEIDVDTANVSATLVVTRVNKNTVELLGYDRKHPTKERIFVPPVVKLDEHFVFNGQYVTVTKLTPSRVSFGFIGGTARVRRAEMHRSE